MGTSAWAATESGIKPESKVQVRNRQSKAPTLRRKRWFCLELLERMRPPVKLVPETDPSHGHLAARPEKSGHVGCMFNLVRCCFKSRLLNRAMPVKPRHDTQ